MSLENSFSKIIQKYNFTDREIKRGIVYCNILDESLVNNQITKKDFKESKDVFNRLLEKAIGHVKDKNRPFDYDDEIISEVYYTNPYLNHVKGKLKKFSKYEGYAPVVDDFLVVLEDFSHIADSLSELKNSQISTNELKKKQKELNPPEDEIIVSFENIEVAKSIIEPELSVIKTELKQKYENHYSSIYEELKIRESNDKLNDIFDYRKRDRSDDPLIKQVASRLSKRESYGSKYTLVDESEAKKWIEKTAKSDAESVVKSFLHKNSRKLAAALEGKSSTFDVEILKSRNVLESSIKVSFKDNSSFVMRNQIVSAVSKNGVWFNRFPTTFKTVRFPNGDFNASLSEKEIFETFRDEVISLKKSNRIKP